MMVYRGVVKGRVVVLDDPVDLPDGSQVEVRPVRPTGEGSEREREAWFLESLVARGMIARIPARQPDPPDLDRTPVEFEGQPLSEMLIEERR